MNSLPGSRSWIAFSIIACLTATALVPPGRVEAGTLFASRFVAYPGQGYTSYMVGADFNEDGRPDLAEASGLFQKDSACIHVATGDERLSVPLRLGFALNDGYPAIAAGRIDDDAHADLVVSGAVYPDGIFAILRGHGDGTFDPPVLHDLDDLGGLPPGIADVTGDLHPDLVFGDYDSAAVRIYPGDGSGGFGAPYEVHALTQAYVVVPADLNGDGTMDLVVSSGDSTVVLLGTGGGAFGPPLIVGGGSGAKLIVRDMNGDGHLDIIAGAGVALGAGDGTFSPPLALLLPPYDVGDFNGDDVPDVAGFFTSGGQRGVGIQLGHGDGTFDAPQYSVSATDQWDLVAGDFTGDSELDVALLGQNKGSVYLLTGRGDGSFGWGLEYPAGATPNPLVAADLDGDGRVDVIAGSGAGAGAGAVSVLRGLDNAVLDAPVAYSTPTAILSVLVADLDGDAAPDVVAASATKLYVWLRNGSGALGARTDLVTLGGTVDAAAGDLNGDGKLDLVAGTTAPTASPRRGLGTETAPSSRASKYPRPSGAVRRWRLAI